MKRMGIVLVILMVLAGCAILEKPAVSDSSNVLGNSEPVMESTEVPSMETELSPQEQMRKELFNRLMDDLAIAGSEREEFLDIISKEFADLKTYRSQGGLSEIDFSVLAALQRDRYDTIGNCYFGEPLYQNQIPVDIEQGMKWYAYAMEYYPSPEVYDSLADQYFEGEYLPQDLNKAMEYYNQAIDAGSFEAADHVANHFYHGATLPFDGDKAYAYYNKALENATRESDVSESKLMMNRCMEQGFGVERDEKQIQRYYDSLLFDWGEYGRDKYFSYAALLRSEQETDPVRANRFRRLASQIYGYPEAYRQERGENRKSAMLGMWETNQDPVAVTMKASVKSTATFSEEMVSALLESFYTLEIGALKGNIGGIQWLESHSADAEELKAFPDFEPMTYGPQSYYIGDYTGQGEKVVIPITIEGTGQYSRFHIKGGLPSSSNATAQVFEWEGRAFFVYGEPQNWGATGYNWVVLAANADGTIESMRLTYANPIPQPLFSAPIAEDKELSGAGTARLEQQMAEAVLATRAEKIYRPDGEILWELPAHDPEEILRPFTEENGFVADIDNDGVEDQIFRGFMIDKIYYKYYPYSLKVAACPDGVTPIWGEWGTEDMPEDLSQLLDTESDNLRQFWTLEDEGSTYCVMFYSDNIVHQARVFLRSGSEVEEINRLLYFEEYQTVDITFAIPMEDELFPID